MKLIDILVDELPKRGGWPEGAAKSASYSHIPGVHFWDGDGFRVDCSDLTTRSLGCEKVTREQYEAAMAAKNDGWIDWPGGECPVEKGTLVDVRYRNGDENHHVAAGVWGYVAAGGDLRGMFAYDWSYGSSGNDIIAYRLHQPQELEQTEAEQEAYLNECIGQTPAAEWNGEGLPPVGCECEWQDKNTKQWNPVKVVYASEWVTVIREINKEKGDDLVEIAIENYGDDTRLKFRPTRSEAERKREKAVQALCNAGGGNGRFDEKSGYGSCWFDVYDAIAAGKIPGVNLED